MVKLYIIIIVQIERLEYLTPEKADNIGKLLSGGMTDKDVAEISGFCVHNVRDIKRGKISRN